MKKETDELLKKAIKSHAYNTNNGWGFGGGIGREFTFPNNVKLRIGRAYYRHLPPSNYVTVSVNGNRILDEATLKLEHIQIINQLIAP